MRWMLQPWSPNLKTAAVRAEQSRAEKKRKEKKRKEKKRKDYAFWGQSNENSSIIPGCPGAVRAMLAMQKQMFANCLPQRKRCARMMSM